MTPQDESTAEWEDNVAKDLLDPSQPVDLTTCDREQVHLLGRVQEFGTLIAIDDSWTVVRAAMNTPEFIGIRSDDLVGSDLREFLSSEGEELVAKTLADISRFGGTHRMLDVRFNKAEVRFDLSFHRQDSVTIIEIELHLEDETRVDHLNLLRPALDDMRSAKSVSDLIELAADYMRDTYKLDRVMLYVFQPDMSGDVVTERRNQGMERYEGMRFPASDIPKQSRILYRKSVFRIIADCEDEGVEVVPKLDPRGKSVDLSQAVLRTVSPIHLEYLSNMGVRASMSVSLVVNGVLWGLIACHNNTPLYLSAGIRSSIELFGQMLSLEIERKLADEERQLIENGRELQGKLLANLSEKPGLIANLGLLRKFVGSIIPNDGMVAFIEGQVHAEPNTLSDEEARLVAKFLALESSREVFVTDHLRSVFPKAVQFSDRVAGIMALPVSRNGKDYVILTRKPLTKVISWAGNPEKLATVGPNGSRLQPRESFEAWQETVLDQCQPWGLAERGVAESLREVLLNVLLKLNDSLNKTRNDANARQALLVAELNHRVKNILTLVRSLVDQSAETDTPEEFARAISGRIEALARAHSLVTTDHWSPTSIKDLLRAETAAYDLEDGTRIHLSGPDAMLDPEAVTPVALALHELTTNAVKYGALSNDGGRVEIQTINEDGALRLVWSERGGPPVSPMRRRGTGSTLIEESIPFDLGGEAEVDMARQGLTARFLVPSEHIAEFNGDPGAETGVELDDDDAQTPLTFAEFNGMVLIVEDNFLVAKEMQKFVENQSRANVEVCSNVPQAMKKLNEATPSLAFLDVNLKRATSLEIAERLQEMGVPFCFATGYGDTPSVRERFPKVDVLAKPVAAVDVRHKASDLLGLEADSK